VTVRLRPRFNNGFVLVLVIMISHDLVDIIRNPCLLESQLSELPLGDWLILVPKDSLKIVLVTTFPDIHVLRRTQVSSVSLHTDMVHLPGHTAHNLLVELQHIVRLGPASLGILALLRHRPMDVLGHPDGARAVDPQTEEWDLVADLEPHARS
jgi:hypothetical protein